MEVISMSTVLVTGGAGFIGSHTSIELLNAGYDIIILDNFVNSKPESLKRIKELAGKDFKFYQADNRQITRLLSERRPRPRRDGARILKARH